MVNIFLNLQVDPIIKDSIDLNIMFGHTYIKLSTSMDKLIHSPCLIYSIK